jgi:hypothetical protein
MSIIDGGGFKSFAAGMPSASQDDIILGNALCDSRQHGAQ